MKLISSWRTALRIAQREARRSKGRSALVVAMIALPVTALAGFAAAYDTVTLTPAEQADRSMGQTDAVMIWPTHHASIQGADGLSYWQVREQRTPTSDPQKDGGEQEQDPRDKPGTHAELLAALPAGSTALPVQFPAMIMKTGAGIGRIEGVAIDGRSPLVAGFLTMLEGRAPVSGSEIALSRAAMARLEASLGGTVTTGDGKQKYTVVGIVEFPWDLGTRMLFSAPVPPTAESENQAETRWFVDVPGDLNWAAVKQLNTLGIISTARSVMLNPPPDSEIELTMWEGTPINTEEVAFGLLIGGLALLEIILMAGPAFAISARRRQRQLALVAANGGTPAHVRRIVFADGVVLGVVGAVTGIAMGIVVAFFAMPFAEELLFQRRGGAFRVFPVALLAIAGLAIVTGLLAALVPAFIIARQDVVRSLAGRRGQTRSRKRWLALGLAGVALGTAIVVYGTAPVNVTVLLAGMVIGELGLVLCTPALVGLVARIGRILPLAPRIALRDAARNRAAAAPAISAVMAAVAGSVALGLILTSQIARQVDSYVPSLPDGYAVAFLPDPTQFESRPGEEVPKPGTPAEIEALLRATLPVSEIRQLPAVGCQGKQDHWCSLQPLPAPDKVCPYIEISQQRELTPGDIAAARADARCADILSEGGPQYGPWVDDGTNLAVVTGATGADLDAAIATLKAGGVLVPDADYLTSDGKVEVVAIDVAGNENVGDPVKTEPRFTFPAYELKTGVLATIVVPPSVVDTVKLGTTPGIMVAATTRMPTSAEEDRFNERLQGALAWGQLERGAPVETPAELLLLMAAAAIIALAAAAVGTGLAAADGRGDLSTLASVGASPRMRRGLSLSQSAVIAGLGSLLGAAAGLGAALAVIAAINFQYSQAWPATLWPVSIPWMSLGVALVVVPAIAMLGAGLLTRSRLPIERRL